VLYVNRWNQLLPTGAVWYALADVQIGGPSQPNSQTIPAPVSNKTIDSQLYRKAHTDKVKDTIAAAEHVWKGYRAFVLKHRRNQ